MTRHPRLPWLMGMALLWAGLSLFLAGCSAAATPGPAPAQPGYLLAGANSTEAFSSNQLALFDASRLNAPASTPLTPEATVKLPAARVRRLQRTADGRLWLGLSGDFNQDDERVLVYSAEGQLLKTLRPCTNPDAGIHPIGTRILIVCSEDGFHGRVVALDSQSYAPLGEVALSLPDAPALLVGSGADDTYLLVTAMTTGPDPQRSYAHLFVIEAATLELRTSLPLGPDTDVWTILPASGRFYLLNAASARASASPRPDLLVIDPGTWQVEARALPLASPLWGAIRGSVLYAYHHPGWNTTQPQAWRGLSRVDMATWQGESWPLPDGFNAGDLSVWNARPCLTFADAWAPPSEHGLYCLNDQGTLTLRVTLADASGIWLP